VDSAGTKASTSKERVEPCCYFPSGNAFQQRPDPNGGEVLKVQMYGTATCDDRHQTCNASHDAGSTLSIGALIKQRAEPPASLPVDPDQDAPLVETKGRFRGPPASPATTASPLCGTQSYFLSATRPVRSRGINKVRGWHSPRAPAARPCFHHENVVQS
jgi:hypothetical protein